MKLNECQTPLENLEMSKETQEKFDNYFYNIPFIRALVSSDRKRAKDLPRDEDGKIIIDLEHPHILENMDYFRKAAITFEKTGKYTELKPNNNPNSEYYKWVKEEVRRCHEGLIRPSDGEWIPGMLYYYLNYTEIQRPVKVQMGKNKKKTTLRMYKPPEFWDGTYWWYHYKYKAREEGLHCCMLSSRGRGKSFNAASDLSKIFKLGETKYNNTGCTCYITASDKKFLVAGDQTLDKFQHDIDYISQNTEWPGREYLANRLQDMIWIAGYKDLDLGNKGTGNSVVGISSNNDVQKLRGTRAVMYIIEEGGTFGNLDKVWNNILPSVEQGQGDEREVFGQIIMFGTAGDKDSDFASMGKMMYHPEGYHIKALHNIYDIEGKGAKQFSYFFPAYLNNAGCYDKNGNSDVTKALYQILKDRENIKKKSGDINAIVKRTAEYPIVPQEAIMRVGENRFPIAEINERIMQLEENEHEFDDTYVGALSQNPDGSVVFKPTTDNVIYDFPLRDNKAEGALQIFKMPEKDNNGRVYSERYVIGHDPVNQDEADSMSLSSTFVIDMWNNSIAAEFTGRRQFQDESFEQLRLLGIFYNAQILYEANNKMCYAYFSKMNCTYMLADTPEYLRERDIVKKQGFGNSVKGISATAILNKHEDDLIEQFLLSPKTIYETNQDGEEIATTIHNVKTIRNLALLKELSAYGPDINVDRCVLKDTMINTNDGIDCIQNIKVGDLVLTADGRYNKVIQLHKNNFNGKKVKFRTIGDFRYLECTDNHPILVKTSPKLQGKYWMINKYKLTDSYYKRADQLTKNDYVLVPTRKNLDFVQIPEDLLYVLGWYIADGNISNGNYVKFFLGEDQYEIGLKLVDILNKYFAKENTFVEAHIDKNGRYIPSYYTPQGNRAFIQHSKDVWNGKIKSMWLVNIASKEAQDFFRYYGGSPNAKDICPELYNKRGLLPLLKGYFEGDGHYRDEVRCDGIRRNSLEVNTIYLNLALKIRQILLDNHLWCTMRFVKTRNKNSHCQYNITLTNNNVIPIIQGSLKFKQTIPVRDKTIKEEFVLDEDGFWVKYRDYNEEYYNGEVYNISVENNPSYVANGVTTHNCRALGVTLILKNAYEVKYGGDIKNNSQNQDDYVPSQDDFFKRNGFI